MSVREVQVTFDCADPAALAGFWCEVLGYRVQPPPSGFDSWDNALAAWGVPPGERNSHSAALPPEGEDGPRMFFQRVPEGKTIKNRLHLDVRVAPGAQGDERTTALDAEAVRLVRVEAWRRTRRRELPPALPRPELSPRVCGPIVAVRCSPLPRRLVRERIAVPVRNRTAVGAPQSFPAAGVATFQQPLARRISRHPLLPHGLLQHLPAARVSADPVHGPCSRLDMPVLVGTQRFVAHAIGRIDHRGPPRQTKDPKPHQWCQIELCVGLAELRAESAQKAKAVSELLGTGPAAAVLGVTPAELKHLVRDARAVDTPANAAVSSAKKAPTAIPTAAHAEPKAEGG